MSMVWGRKDRDEKRRQEGEPEGADPVQHDEPQEAEDRLAQLAAERDEAHQKYLRTLADYQNSQRRAVSNEQEARSQGVTSVVLSVLPVIDHFELALGQDPGKVSVEQLRAGIQVIHDELLRVLQKYGVEQISPKANDEFNPVRHQAVVQQDVEGVDPGRVVATLQNGYALGERVIRPATVAVRPRHEEHELPPGDHHENEAPPT
jgi:molecular chaperone GrpE